MSETITYIPVYVAGVSKVGTYRQRQTCLINIMNQNIILIPGTVESLTDMFG